MGLIGTFVGSSVPLAAEGEGTGFQARSKRLLNNGPVHTSKRTALLRTILSFELNNYWLTPVVSWSRRY
jgi:hypothetical protein